MEYFKFEVLGISFVHYFPNVNYIIIILLYKNNKIICQNVRYVIGLFPHKETITKKKPHAYIIIKKILFFFFKTKRKNFIIIIIYNYNYNMKTKFYFVKIFYKKF